jgi:hypothetical protein
LIEEADRLEMVKGGMDKRIEEIDMETVKRRRD